MSFIECTGSCLCGDVTVKATSNNNRFLVCHCDTCKKWNGGPQFALPCSSNVDFNGEIAEFSSSPWATRGFCRKCGTHLYFKLNESGGYNILLGVLDIDKNGDLELAIQYCIDQKPSYYKLESDSQQVTESEMVEMFNE